MKAQHHYVHNGGPHAICQCGRQMLDEAHRIDDRSLVTVHVPLDVREHYDPEEGIALIVAPGLEVVIHPSKVVEGAINIEIDTEPGGAVPHDHLHVPALRVHVNDCLVHARDDLRAS